MITTNQVLLRRKLPTTLVCTASGALSPQPLGACCETVRAVVSCSFHPGAGPHWTALLSVTLAAAASALLGDTAPPVAVSAQTPESYREWKLINDWFIMHFGNGWTVNTQCTMYFCKINVS